MLENTYNKATSVQHALVISLGVMTACASNSADVQPPSSIGAQAGAPASVIATAPAQQTAVVPAASGAPGQMLPTVTATTAAPQAPAGPAAATPASMAAPSQMPAQTANLTTYQRDIRPIVEARCLGCHVAGGVGPFALDSWESVNMLKAVIMPAVMSGRMPPWPADDTDCVKQRNNQRLNDAQLALFTKWQADGFQQGDPSEFSPLVEDEPAPELGEPDMVIRPQAHQLTANFEGYVCQQTDANLTEDVWVRALDMKPEHAEYVHHAIVNIGNGDCDALGLSAENLYSYRPGSRTVVFEEGDAMLLKAGQRIAIQFHFNTKGAKPAASYPTDASPLRLWTLPKGQKPMRQIHRQPVHGFNITIPVGAKNQSVKASAALEAGTGAEIIGISPHMHLLGQKFKSSLSGGPGNGCLVDIPDWDQSWQIDYLYKPSAYIKAMPGMTISQECVYSNGPEDQGIGPDGKPYTPQLTTFGEDTRNEMCLGYVWYRAPLR
ncbi:MAG TPA: hypothetical protein VFN67_26275 [Polyangiales bacterium]|nr:hypothetical protein [Polyangiales bacterium]